MWYIDCSMLSVFLCCILAAAVGADTIVTVDDTDTSLILYEPPSSWEASASNPLDSNGSYTFTTDPTATAIFSFTGVAIYFWSPLWPFDMTTALSLDDGDTDIIQLQDLTQSVDEDGSETVQSAIVWSRTGLDNIEHTLVISVGDGDNMAIVDRLDYTVPDVSTSSSATPTTTTGITLSIISTIALSTPSASAATKTTHQSKTGLSIALGTVCAVFGLLVLYALLWYWRRRQRRRAEEESVTHNDLPPPDMTDVSPGNGYGYVRPRSSQYRAAAAAAAAATDAREAEGKARGASRRPGPSNLRHSTTAPPSPVASNPLTTIPEISTREDVVGSPPWKEFGDTPRLTIADDSIPGQRIYPRPSYSAQSS